MSGSLAGMLHCTQQELQTRVDDLKPTARVSTDPSSKLSNIPTRDNGLHVNLCDHENNAAQLALTSIMTTNHPSMMPIPEQIFARPKTAKPMPILAFAA